MPEGPEIRRAADKIAKAIVNQPVSELYFAFDHLKRFEAQLQGQKIVSVTPRGKALLTRFEAGLSIYSHNQLYGIWVIRKAQSYPNTKRQLRLAIHNSQKSALLYSASDIEVLDDFQVDNHPFLTRIGPDVLDPNTTIQQVADRLIDRAFVKRRLSLILLDQHFLSGLGNYLRSEILFVAGVYPELRPIDCTETQIAKLAKACIEIPIQSYQTGGITNELSRAMALKAKGEKRWQYRHYVFSREGRSCYSCEAPIVKSEFGGRRCYFCPSCQAR
jgi:endonuclease VIII